MVKYKETINTEEYTVYIVEAMWPDTTEWGAYYRWAFNDYRSPNGNSKSIGSFESKNADVSDVPERLSQDKWRDIVAFSTPEAALAYAERFRLYARPKAAWDYTMTPDHWSEKYRKPCDARVVEERLAKTSRVVVG